MREAGLIPTDRAEALVDLFAECFPAETARTDIITGLQGSVADFEAMVKRAWSITFDELLVRFAIENAGAVHTKNDDLNMVEIEEEIDLARPVIKLGHWFRLVFHSPFLGNNIIAFQRTGGATIRLPTALDDIRSFICVPSSKADGSKGYIRELNDLGQHEFIAIHLTKPLPVAINEALSSNALIASSDLDQLSAHVAPLPSSERIIFIHKVTVTDSNRTASDD